MKQITQKQISEWTGLKEPFLSRILRGQKRPSASKAEQLEQITGVSMRDWMLLPAGQLKQKIFIAWDVHSRETNCQK